MNKSITLSQRQVKALIKQIASRCEQAYRRGAQQALALRMSPDDASWYRYHLLDKFRGESFHLIAHRIPEFISAEDAKKWPKAAQKNPSRYYAQQGRYRTAVEVHGLSHPHNSQAYTELDDLISFANHKPQ
jgi:hypothetical protein